MASLSAEPALNVNSIVMKYNITFGPSPNIHVLCMLIWYVMNIMVDGQFQQTVFHVQFAVYVQ